MLVTIIMVFGLVISAYAPAATEELAAPEEPAPKQPAEVEAGSVGIEMDNQSLFLF